MAKFSRFCRATEAHATQNHKRSTVCNFYPQILHTLGALLLDVDENKIYCHKENVGTEQTNRNVRSTNQPFQIPLVGKINTILSITRVGNLCGTHLKPAEHILNFAFFCFGTKEGRHELCRKTLTYKRKEHSHESYTFKSRPHPPFADSNME